MSDDLDDLEAVAISKGRGKWAQAGVPHKGWECVDVIDVFLDDPTAEFAVCEMCETQKIRFIHLMHHEDYETDLKCGCVCAGHMEQNYARARDREKEMRSAAAKRDRFPRRKGWKVTRTGDPYIKVEGHFFFVEHRKGGYAVNAKPRNSYASISGRKVYASEEAARRAAFDALEYVRRRSGS